MAESDQRALATSLRDLFANASNEFADYACSLTMSSARIDELREHHERLVRTQVLNLYSHLCFAFEHLDTPQYLSDLKSGFSEYLKDPGAIDVTPEGDLYSPPLAFLRAKAGPILALASVSTSLDEALLERILRSTGYLIHRLELQPSREHDVQRAMYSILSVVFQDTVPEVSIPHIFKTYRPDFGIPSLHAAIEYKFITSRDDLKRAVSGVFEDVHAYLPSEEWQRFYSVYYMNDAYTFQEQLEAEYELAKVSGRWKPILVVGRGQREQ